MNEETNINYENRLVAFIDVMGFKELLTNKNENIEKLKSYYQTASEFLFGKSSFYNEYAESDNFQKMFVSDAIILSVKLNDHNVIENFNIAARFFSSIGLLQYILAMKSQIWTRGAVSIGNLYINENKNILVGPAFVQAYELEQKADYPRVIVDPKILRFFSFGMNPFIAKINECLKTSQLIGLEIPPRFDIQSLKNDAIFIDWFRQIFDRNESFDNFFEDLQDRRFNNHALFEKSYQLCKYLEESVLSYRDFVGLENTNSRFKAIARYIDSLK